MRLRRNLKMKDKNKLLLIKIAIPVIIIGGCFGIDGLIKLHAENISDNPTVVSIDSASMSAADSTPLEIVSRKAYGNVEGFSANLGFIGDDEALVGIGLSKEEFYKKYPNAIDPNDNKNYNNAINDIDGIIYKLKLSTLEKQSLNQGINVKDSFISVAIKNNKINYVNDNNYNIYDLNNNSNYQYYQYIPSKSQTSQEVSGGNWSDDGNFIISSTSSYIHTIKIYNVKEKTAKNLKIKNNKLGISFYSGFYSKDGKDIYFIGNESKNVNSKYSRDGIFKINSSTGETQEVLTLPYCNMQDNSFEYRSDILRNDYSVLDGGKKILLEAVINGTAGSYIYDVDTKKFYNVVPHTVKSKEGLYCSPMWISPDKTKVIYMNRALENNKEQWNLYAAKINGNSFTNKICLYKNINLSGSLDNYVQWSGDSKKILFFTYNNQTIKNGFSFPDKNQVNIITFK
jgi:hypothetical protein